MSFHSRNLGKTLSTHSKTRLSPFPLFSTFKVLVGTRSCFELLRRDEASVKVFTLPQGSGGAVSAIQVMYRVVQQDWDSAAQRWVLGCVARGATLHNILWLSDLLFVLPISDSTVMSQCLSDSVTYWIAVTIWSLSHRSHNLIRPVIQICQKKVK